MHQFFVDREQIGTEYITITGEDVKHIKNVLRMKEGEEVRISDGAGGDFFCTIEKVTSEEVLAKILPKEAGNTELPNRIFLFQAVPKGERMEYVIQKAVELGVYEIIPVEMKYCVVRLDDKKKEKKRERWQAIAKSAAKQAKRSRIPEIHPVMSYNKAVEYIMMKFSLLNNIIDFLPVMDVYKTLLPVGLALGAGIGFLGSFITIRKHLHA